MSLSRHVDYTKPKEHLANVLTLSNLGFGILAIIFVTHGFSHMSLLMIALAALFDRFDGMVARKFDTVSQFGKELDSLSDLVSFGVAPAMLIYERILSDIPGLGVTLTVLYILCGAIRLARFNVKEFDGAFCGIPITAAGVVLVLSSFLAPVVPAIAFVGLIMVLMVLMVSNIRVVKF